MQQTGTSSSSYVGRSILNIPKFGGVGHKFSRSVTQEGKGLPLTEVIAAANGVSIHQRPLCTDWTSICPELVRTSGRSAMKMWRARHAKIWDGGLRL